jgi:prophage maintenance system killer protein
VIALDVADLVVIAGQTLGTGPDVALAQIDIAAAQAALTAVTDRVIVDQDTAAAAGVALMHSLLRHRPFVQHGEQVAVAAGLQFLSLNGWQAELDPPAAAAIVVEALASGQLSPVSAAAWLSPRLSPRPRGVRPGRVRPRGMRVGRMRVGRMRPGRVRPGRVRVSGSTVRRPGDRVLTSVVLAVALGVLALLATACSRGAGDPAGSPTSREHAHAADLAYTSCMRSHGITAFPYASAAGVIVLTGINRDSPRYRSAEQACQGKAAVHVASGSAGSR